MKIIGLFTELREKENIAKTIKVTSDYGDDERVIKLLFHTPGGKDKISDRVPMANGVGLFALPNVLLDKPGILTVQAYAYGDGELLEKSSMYEFKVRPSINPESAVDIYEEGLTTLETVLVHLDRLEEEKKVLYSEQELSAEEMELARLNIGITPVAKDNDMTQPVGMDSYGRFFTAPYDDSDVVKSVNGETVDSNGNVNIHIPSTISEIEEDENHRTVTDAQKNRINNCVLSSDVTNNVTQESAMLVTSGAVYSAIAEIYTSVQEMIGDIDSVVQRIADVIGGDTQ